MFNDKTLKGVTEAVAKIMGEELKGNQHKIDANKNGKVDAHDFKLLRAKKTMKEEEQEDDLQEGEQGDLRRVANRMMNISGKKYNINTQKAKLKSKVKNDAANMPVDSRKDAITGLRKINKMIDPMRLNKPTSEAVDLGEEKGDVHVRNKKSGKELMIPAIAVSTYEKHGYFPVPGSVREGFDDMDKYVKDKSKESSFEKKKTDKGTMYSRKPPKPETEKKVEEGFDDMDKYMKDKNKPQPSGSAGKKPGKAYGGSKQPEEKKSMTEMLELYNEHGLKVLSMMNTKSVKFGDTEVELLDADDVNGFVETVVEEVDNETFTKEVNAQKAKAEGKGKKAEVAKASVQAVKQEEVETPSIHVRSMYTKHYAKHGGTISKAKEASTKAYDAVEKMHGKEMRDKLQTFHRKNMNEETEQLDELSKDTLSMYVKKAHRAGGMADFKHGMQFGVVQKKDREGLAKISHKREKGINKAVDRLAKEEVELGEARKLEGSYKNAGGHESKVYKLSGEHNEGDPYHVKLFKGGKHHEPADYFTNDKDDAHSTAKRMVKESLDERHLTAAETKEKEMNVKGMKKNLSGFKARYGDDAKSVMYATATKQAKKD
jgi:hypothetical protein